MKSIPMKSIPFFTLSDIEQDFDTAKLERGASYQKEGRVTNLDVGHDRFGHWKIKSNIKGSGENTYSTDIIVNFKDQGFHVDGYCSCPMDHNCKHVAATLFETIARQTAPETPTPIIEATTHIPTPIFRIMTSSVRFKTRPWSMTQDEKKMNF
jgi:uncharacterized Zn finger protein